MNDWTDQEWLRRLKNNDPEAWNQLLYKMYNWARTTIKGDLRTQENVDNAVSATCEQLMAVGIPTYRFEGSFLGYCRTITVRECLALVRRINRTPRHIDIDEAILPSTHPEPTADLTQVWERLKPCLDKLEEREREILLQIDYYEVSPQLVAEEWKITRTHTNIIAYRARLKMQKCMKKQGYQGVEGVFDL